MPSDPDWKPPWIDTSRMNADARLKQLIAGVQALPRYDCLVRDDGTRHQGTLRQEPDGIFYFVDEVQRLIAAAQKGCE